MTEKSNDDADKKTEELEDWKRTEYEQASEDIRTYQTQGWQIPLATIGVDALFIGAAWTAKTSRVAAGILILLAGILTTLVELEMLRWRGRTNHRAKILVAYDREHKFHRFGDEDPANILPLGLAFFVLVFVMGIALLIGGVYILLYGFPAFFG